MDFDGIVVGICHLEVADTENRGKHGASKSSSTGDGLILIKSGGKSFARVKIFIKMNARTRASILSGRWVYLDRRERVFESRDRERLRACKHLKRNCRGTQKMGEERGRT